MVMKDFIDSLNFCQLTTIIWGILFILNIFKRNILDKVLGIALIVLSIATMMWGLGNGNEFDEYK